MTKRNINHAPQNRKSLTERFTNIFQDNFRIPKGTKMLWNASAKGTYVRAKHGELK